MVVPDFQKIVGAITGRGFKVEFQSARYRPPYQFMLGLLLEPISRLKKKVMRGTWALYGFEAIIWATRVS